MSIKKLILVIIGLAIAGVSYSQTGYSLKGCIRNMPYTRLYLCSMTGEQTTIIDSATTFKECFEFSLKPGMPVGMYSLLLSKSNNAYIRFIFNNENVELTADLTQLLSSMSFTQSEENKLYYGQEKMVSSVTRKKELLERLKADYDPSDNFYKQINTEISELKKNLLKQTNATIKMNPGTYTSHLLKARQEVSTDSVPAERRSEYLKKHYFDNVDLSYSPLIHNDRVPLMLRNYISLFENKGYTYLEQEKNYEMAIDAIFSISNMSAEMREFVIKQLLNNFMFGDYDILGAYINERYVLSNTCETGVQAANVTQRIDKIRRVAVGKTAPEINMVQASGDSLRLSAIAGDYTLVVFWATTCPHCTEMLPKLKKIYDRRKAAAPEVLAISLDMDENKWKDFNKAGGYSWISYCDHKGAASPICNDYNITGTPTFFLLDKNKTIVAKPASIEELTTTLTTMKLID